MQKSKLCGEMKLICDGAEHLVASNQSTTTTDKNHHTHLTSPQDLRLDLSCEQTEEDTEDEQKTPLLSINQRLSEIYVSSEIPLRSTWASEELRDKQPNLSDVLRPRHKYCPFPFRRDINHRVSIWDGAIDVLEVEAVSITANSETLRGAVQSQQWANETRSQTENLFRRALAERSDYSGSNAVQVTPGFQLKAKYILHTPSPVFSDRDKLRTVSETELHSWYRNVLTKAVDLGVKSVALCSVYSQESDLCPDNRAHIALRTVRRFLEAHPEFRVVLCVERSERSLYNVLAPLYFPASATEEETATWQLPSDLGGSFGEPIDSERQIRIIQNPQHDAMSGADDDSDTSPHDLEGGNRDLEQGTVLLNLNNHPSFTQMQGDLDRQRLLGDRPRVGVYESVIEESLEGIEHQERYEKLLKRAQTEDLREVSGIGCLYQSGVDRLGRPVIVFCGKWFPAQNINLEKALLYLIYLLDPIVNGDYVISYFHTLTGSSNYPSLHWLKDVYTVLPYKYKKNLKAFYIVHPTIWTKMVTWWFTTFMAPAIKAKVHSLPGVEHLYSAISKDQLEIPAYITEYDMTVNGLHYFQPTGPTSS